MARATGPSVTIGLPAYNGGKYLATCLESILAQTYTDLEVVISDDASTDHTEEICRHYAALDRRVRYHRNRDRLGGAPNFNRVFELASGRYFKWAAQDDLIAPDFLARSVAALEADPGAVLCRTWVGVIDEHGDRIGQFQSPLERAAGDDPAERFGCAILRHHMALEIYGVIRSDVLRATRLLGGYPRSDSALVAELALAGRFIEIPEPLFLNRDHPDRYMRAVASDLRRAILWHDRSKAGQRLVPTWMLYHAYYDLVRGYRGRRSVRLRCYGHLLRWLTVNWNALRLAVESASALEPRTLTVAMHVKRRVFGSVLPDFPHHVVPEAERPRHRADASTTAAGGATDPARRATP
ncbi:MAG TPA: glycosyltransferase family 2 protein [Geminicoccaceae bacterium]|nr:glycosyltransferase family 2 protein [Geminicoccaceae bacterium]